MQPEHLEALAAEVALSIKRALAPVQAKLAELDARISLTAGETALTLSKDLGAIRERVAVLEVRPALPGPPGDPGPPGKDGADGKAGLTFKGVFSNDRTYDIGDVVRWGGSTYHCIKATTGVKPDATPPYTVAPDGTKDFRGVSGMEFWELFVSKGDPGKAAR